MRTNIRPTASIATTRQGRQMVVRTIDASLRHLMAFLKGLKRGGMLAVRPWYALVPAAPVVRPVVSPVVYLEQQCFQRHQMWRPDRRSCSTTLLGNASASGNVSAS